LVDADAELNALVLRQRAVGFCHCRLQLGRAAHRVNDAGELD